MSRYAGLALAALLCAGVVPALAAGHRVGSVEFSMRRHHDSTRASFRSDAVALTARDGDVFCRDVQAHFNNGRTRTILQNAAVTYDQTVNVDLPGGVRNVNQLDFDCWSIYSWRTRVDVVADM
jgi:hypothetical protein